ncbi:MAG: hypothetical protein OXB84_08460 [Halobacteriovoraceae bacterium]|nr:hypothetical protein [Halobacteriovoraceae bacterium]
MENRGSVTLVGLLAVLFTFAFFTATIAHGLLKLKEIQNRANLYLCLKKQIINTRRYIAKIGKINIAINTAFAASMLPGGEIARKTIGLLQNTQVVFHVSHVRKLMSLKYCSIKQKLSFLNGLPYQMAKGWGFKRNSRGITKIRKKRWKIFVVQGKIILQTNWQMNSALDRDSIPATKEVGLPYGNHSYGLSW